MTDISSIITRGMAIIHDTVHQSVTLRVPIYTHAADEDVVETGTDTTIDATSIQEITDEMRQENPGWFGVGTYVLYFKGTVANISVGNKIYYNAVWYKIIRARNEAPSGTKAYQEAIVIQDEIT